MNKKGSDLVGRTVKGYKIIKSIGEGKFSEVYRAENEDKNPYALKNIKIFDMADQKSRDKCLKEVEMMKPLDHPNIIKYIDSFIENNELYIVTEWAEKGDLKKLIKEHSADENPFDESTIWEYMRQVASALKHMHDRKTMHRDLKPANIFISSDMSMKVGDLGLGRVFGSETLEAYSKVGTPLYMSPELIQGDGYNFNADVWSLGCICYELCELNSPFRNKQEKMSLMDLFENITKCNYKPISSKYSPELSEIIKKMIVVDPNYRLTSEQVLEIAEKKINNTKKPFLDPLIVMEDVYVKLNLLDYLKNFCSAAERKAINKFYFAVVDENSKNNDQLFYFLELCYWILALSRPEKKKEKLAIFSKTNIDWSSPESACRKLIVDLNGVGVRLDEIDLESILNGYGESICYILNEVLNRELIRINFQFKEPKQTPINGNMNENTDNNDDESKGENLEDEIERSESSESIEEESQFEQSLFFKKNNKKLGSDDMKILEKIQEFGGEDEDKDMIVGKIDEKEWKMECLRVDKKMNEITTYAKEARKKFGLQNLETVKVNSSKISDLMKSVRPIANRLSNEIEKDLSLVKAGEERIQSCFIGIGEEYRKENMELKDLSNRSMLLESYVKERIESLERMDEKLHDMNYKIEISSNETNNRVSEIKKSIINLEQEIKGLEVKEKILEWQVRNYLMKQSREGRKNVEIGESFEFQDN